MNSEHRIIIAGGGTAGWMTAALTAHRFKHFPVSITLVESSQIATIGVGEGSTPSLKQFFTELGISDETWMPECSATYKVGIQFCDWSPASGVPQYRHPFISQLDTFSQRPFEVNCQTRRLGLDVTTLPDKFLFNGYLAKAQCLPVTPPNFPFRMEYGYHFDSARLGQFLKKHAQSLGVQHVDAKIAGVDTHPDGSLSSLIDTNSNHYNGDLFIDCTGFRSLLLQQTLNVPFTSFADNLFNNKAMVLATEPTSPLPVETKATALSNGWAWQIPLQTRTGNGYVYSDAYQSQDSAEQEFRRYLGVSDAAQIEHLSMQVGQVEQHWVKNCVALGLSQGFIEPLEATALHLVYQSARLLCEQYQKSGFNAQQSGTYNQQVSTQFDNVRDYIVAHYKLNTRNDTAYWQHNRNNGKLSDSLMQILDTWYRGEDLAAHLTKKAHLTHFNSISWHCLLAGYGTFPALATQQPGQGDLFKEHQLQQFFEGCLLNFKA
ncbi:tryptophan halogenase family protein [Alteromonas lipotrueiana]|uniref:tryptophan halogenase family protein n=1 Tax=Alteromonas lipotrueiana TaxID=2803815 RepID=UPI001C43CF04|nr:tryptophan halogenase family protein [Alteromonas lipotrueiana]